MLRECYGNTYACVVALKYTKHVIKRFLKIKTPNLQQSTKCHRLCCLSLYILPIGFIFHCQTACSTRTQYVTTVRIGIK